MQNSRKTFTFKNLIIHERNKYGSLYISHDHSFGDMKKAVNKTNPTLYSDNEDLQNQPALHVRVHMYVRDTDEQENRNLKRPVVFLTPQLSTVVLSAQKGGRELALYLSH